MSASNDLTFIRCPSCRSLVPAVSSRCRMCGNSLRSDAQPESTEERKAARVRQPTASLSSAEADRLHGDSENLINYPTTHSEESFLEEGEAEQEKVEEGGIEDIFGAGDEIEGVVESGSVRDTQDDFGAGTAARAFEEVSESSEGESAAVELLAEVSEENSFVVCHHPYSEENSIEFRDKGGDIQQMLGLEDDAPSSVNDQETDLPADEGGLAESAMVLEEVGGDALIAVLGSDDSSDVIPGWQDLGETQAIDEQSPIDFSSPEAGASSEEVNGLAEPTEPKADELSGRGSDSVRGGPRTLSRQLNFSKRQSAPAAEQKQPSEETTREADVQASHRFGKPLDSSPRWGSNVKRGSGAETPSITGTTDRSALVKTHLEPARDAAGRGRAATNARTAPAQLADSASSRLFGWLVSYKDSSGSAIELREGKTLLTGSSLKKGDLVLEAPSISTPHAMFTMRADSGLYVQDLMSERGVWVRRKQEDTYQREEDGVELAHGDWVRFGDEEFLVSLVPYMGVQ